MIILVDIYGYQFAAKLVSERSTTSHVSHNAELSRTTSVGSIGIYFW
jgi:hypothetical protein